MEPSLKTSAVVVLLSLAACRTRAPSVDVADAAPIVVEPAGDAAPVAVASPVDAGAPTSTDAGVDECDPSRAPKVFSRMPCITKDGAELMAASRQVGFSKDGRYLGMCISSCDPCPLSCDFDDAVEKKRINVHFSFGPAEPDYGRVPEEVIEKRMKARDDKTQKFLDDHRFPTVGNVRKLTGTWPYPDIVFAMRSEAVDKNGTAVLDFGASVDGADPVFPIHIVIGPTDLWRKAPSSVPSKLTGKEREEAITSIRSNYLLAAPELVYVDLSPDGKDLGVVAFTTGSMWYEEAKWVRMPVATFAARVREMTKGRKP